MPKKNKGTSVRQEIFHYLDSNPNANNEELIEKFPSPTYKENSVKTYGTQWRNIYNKDLEDRIPGNSRLKSKGIRNGIEDLEWEIDNFDDVEKIDVDLLRRLLIHEIKRGNITPATIRGVTEYLKLTGEVDEKVDDELNMEMMRQFGVNLKSSD